LQQAPALPPAVEAVPESEPGLEPPVEPVRGGNGKHARAATTYDDSAVTAVAARDPADTAKIEARAAEMLAMLKADLGNPLGPMADRLATTQSRVVTGLIGLVGVSLTLWLVMTVLGHLV
jgi:hypothetical protein